MATVTKPVALDETFNTTDATPVNIADVLKDGLSAIEEAIGGGSSGGHTIQDAEGTALTQRSVLQFGGTLQATDDSTNGKTVVSDEAEEIEWSVWNAMTEVEQNAYSAGKKLNILNAPVMQAEDVEYDNTDSGLSATDVQSAIDEIASAIPVGATGSAGFHNCIYRGKYLGSSLTTEQCANIASGTFDDMFIGDYWTIGGVNYRIAAFDYYYNTGDTACATHHVTVVPDARLATGQMNSTNTTEGAYAGSEMYTTNMAAAKSIIESAFGSAHILSHRQYLKNAVTNGYESGGAQYDSTIELMTEQNVYGGKIFANCTQGTNFADQSTIDKSQYPLFAMNPTKINARTSYWLRDVATSASFCYTSVYGMATAGNASGNRGIRPAFSIY